MRSYAGTCVFCQRSVSANRQPSTPLCPPTRGLGFEASPQTAVSPKSVGKRPVRNADGTTPVELVSFDGGTRLKSSVTMPDRYRFWDGQPPPCGISRGAGLSYVAASFSSSGC